MSLVNRRISVRYKTMSNRCNSVFGIPEVSVELSELHEKYVAIPAVKASNIILLIYKPHYINCLIEELRLSTSTGNPTYTPASLSRGDILDNHDSIIFHLVFPSQRRTSSSLNCIGFRNRNNAVLRILSGVQESPSLRFLREFLRLQRYCSITYLYARSVVNEMWILNMSKKFWTIWKPMHFWRSTT